MEMASEKRLERYKGGNHYQGTFQASRFTRAKNLGHVW